MAEPAKSTYDKLITNADGSVDHYFSPTAPAGKESSWIKTFRVGEAFFGKSWRLADFKKVK